MSTRNNQPCCSRCHQFEEDYISGEEYIALLTPLVPRREAVFMVQPHDIVCRECFNFWLVKIWNDRLLWELKEADRGLS